MKYRTLAGQEVSILGFGCMRLPVIDGDMGNINEPEATKMLHYAIDQGVNYVDTAWPYHRGASEPFTGKALKNGYREKVYLATKLPTWLINSHEDCDKYLNEQLEKLQTDYIDFYLIHALDEGRWETVLNHRIIEFCERAKKDGRVRYFGFSFHDYLKTFKKIIDAYDWEFCQIQYNYMDENFQAGTDGYNYAVEKNVDVIVMEPLRGGKLTKRVPDEVKALMDKHNINASPAELALRWVWNKPDVSCVLSGMSTMEHVEENCRIADYAMPNSMPVGEEMIIRNIRDIYRDRIQYDCTSCGYCLPCPENVEIPLIIQAYNDLNVYGDEKWARAYYQIAVRPERQADKCVQCGQCEDQCPQHIEIIEALKKAHEALSE